MLTGEIREEIKWSFFYLLVFYLIMVSLLELKVISKFSFNLSLLAIVIGILGITLSHKKINYDLPDFLIFIGFGFAFILRLIPYIHNTVPLGYDSGLYKFVFEHPLKEAWIKSAYPLGFTLIMHALTFIISSEFLITYFFVLLSASTVFVIYLVVKKLFNKRVAIISSLIYPLSTAQLQTFWFNYYKNVIGIMLLLIGFLYFKEKKEFNWQIVLIGTIIALFHRPALFIFGTSFVIYSLIFYKNKKNAIIYISLISLLSLSVNYDRITTYLLPGISAVGKSIVKGKGGSGTFFNIRDYFYYMIAFIPFAITGFLKTIRKNKAFSIAAIVTMTVVFFDLFFHNRFIIYLDLFVIIYSALGFDLLIREKKSFGLFLLISFIIITSIVITFTSINLKPLISEKEFNTIQQLNNILPKDSYIMVTSSYYSPWIKGWVNRPVIAPGLFNNDKLSKKEWLQFWNDKNRTKYLNRYHKPLYIFIGQRQKQLRFNSTCFKLILNKTDKIYEYECEK